MAELLIKFSFFLPLAMATQVHIPAGHLGCPVPPPHHTTALAPQEVHLQTVSPTGEALFLFDVHMALFCTGIFECNSSDAKVFFKSHI